MIMLMFDEMLDVASIWPLAGDCGRAGGKVGRNRSRRVSLPTGREILPASQKSSSPTSRVREEVNSGKHCFRFRKKLSLPLLLARETLINE